MQLITNELISTPSVHGSIKMLSADIDLLEKFVAHANGCGLESLDTASGQLIESGLATRYPNHFQVGSGLEGISGLIETLKKGVAGLKKMARGKDKPFLKKMNGPVYENIEKTYASDEWYESKKARGGTIKCNGLGKLVGEFKDFDALLAAVKTTKQTLDDAFKVNTKLTTEYIKKADVQIDAVDKLKGKSDEELTAYGNEQIAIFKPLLKALDDTAVLPTIKIGSGSAADISTDQAKALGKLMLSLLDYCGDIEEIAEGLRIDGAGQSIFVEIDGGSENKALEELQWGYWYWDVSAYSNTDMMDKTAQYLYTVIQQLELVILDAVK